MSLQRTAYLLPLVAALLLAAGGWWYAHSAHFFAPAPDDTASPPLFSREQVDQFLAAVKIAESMTDPLQRCLNYPAPPKSHWSHAVVSAFCHFRLETTISFDEVRDLIQSGRAADLDRRLVALAQSEKARGRTQDRVNVTLIRVFYNKSTSVREVADAWKRQSPKSAYAYAASGMAYIGAAATVRGEDDIGSTANERLDEMARLIALGRRDLDRAVALDPACIPAYVEMIIAARFGGDTQYGTDAAMRALAIDPASYSIHEVSAWLAMPTWGGSAEAVQRVMDDAKAHERANPLLVVVQTEAASYAADVDHCDARTAECRAAFARVFDNVSIGDALGWAGLAASRSDQHDMAIVYLSESIRFNPGTIDIALDRVDNLIEWGNTAFALTEAQRILALAPHYQRAYSMRGYAYEQTRDYVHAEQDYRTALTLPGDQGLWTMIELGNLYVFTTHEWDKGWEIADQLIRDHPSESEGWILRGRIQEYQPRPGLHDTLVYILAHFANDPKAQRGVAHVRALLANEKH